MCLSQVADSNCRVHESTQRVNSSRGRHFTLTPRETTAVLCLCVAHCMSEWMRVSLRVRGSFSLRVYMITTTSLISRASLFFSFAVQMRESVRAGFKSSSAPVDKIRMRVSASGRWQLIWIWMFFFFLRCVNSNIYCQIMPKTRWIKGLVPPHRKYLHWVATPVLWTQLWLWLSWSYRHQLTKTRSW